MAKAKKVAQEQVMVVIPKLNVQQVDITVIGDSSLVVHSWSDKARKIMLDKQMKKATATKDPERDYIESLYWCSEKPESPTMKDVEKGEFGFPAKGFKMSAVLACHQDRTPITRTAARGAFHVIGDIIPIKGRPEPREDMVRVGGRSKSADIRYRGEFKTPWSAKFRVRYNGDVLSAEQLVAIFDLAGFLCGLGEDRPERGGSWGMFHVAKSGEIA